MASTSIGTAWIQIKPTTKGLRQAINSELNAANVGAQAGSSFTSGFAAKLGAISGVTQSIFSKVTSLVSGQFDAAISRVDRLNNFSNVMSNLNIPVEESEATIERLSDRLTGLPTSLDSAASAVQRFTTKNGDVEKSADLFLALNDALIAGGASADIQSSALEQISQAYAKGKPDMIEWRSLLQAMPAQATQIGKAFGMSTEELGEALRTGELSMDDFMNKIVDLDKAGENGFKSFAEQARAATDTIQTRMANVSTSLTKVVAAALNGDDLEKPLSQLVDRVTELAPQLITGFTRAVIGLLPAVAELIPPILETILGLAPEIFDGITKLVVGLVQMLPQLIPIFTTALPTIINSIVTTLLAPETLSAILQAGVELFTQLVLAVPDVILALVDALPDLIANIVSFLTDPDNIFKIITAAVTLFFGLVEAVPKIVGALLEAFGTLFAKLWTVLKENFGKFAANFGEFLGGIFKTAINGVLAFIENFINAPIKLINGFVELINSAFGFIGVNIGKIGLVQLPRLATGGLVTGVGTDYSDSNIYALSRGEFVIRAAAAREIGYQNLERMNSTGELPSQTVQNYFTINGYDKSPEELADIISRKIALKTQGVLG